MADLTYTSLFRNRIVTMATAPPNNMVTTVCDNGLSLADIQRDAIMNNVWDCFAYFQGFNNERIQNSERESTRLPASCGGCYFGSVAMEKLQGLLYWINKMLLCGHTLVFDGFDTAMMRQLIDDADTHYTKSKRDSDAQTLSKFKYDECNDWQQSVITYIN